MEELLGLSIITTFFVVLWIVAYPAELIEFATLKHADSIGDRVAQICIWLFVLGVINLIWLLAAPNG